ncbi:unnamed protein product [Coffea canephora]|uniref:Uncharacterized protein n=1 Tax=Coffea canephora TaxID=49390 RepID=A0A068UTW4_COFCA|nr:unnamed protein product [Coffea canephora]
MVQLRALLTLLALFLLFCSSSAHSAAAGVHRRAQGKHGRQQKRPRFNHGSFRGPQKHLLDPTAENPFVFSKLAV